MDVAITKDIMATQDRVFSIFTDLGQAAGRISGIEKIEILTGGPMRIGTRWRETRVMYGKEATEEMEITTFDPPNSYQADARSHDMHYISEYKFSPIDNGAGTRVEMRFTGIPQTFMAKIMGTIMGKMMRNMMINMMINCMGADMGDLRNIAERSDKRSDI